MHAYTDLVDFIQVLKQAVHEVSGLGDRVGGHADIAESSIMMVMHPGLVREDLAEDGFHPLLDPEVVRRIIDGGFRSVTPNGILGDARGMSPAIGERCIEVAAAVALESLLPTNPSLVVPVFRVNLSLAP